MQVHIQLPNRERHSIWGHLVSDIFVILSIWMVNFDTYYYSTSVANQIFRCLPIATDTRPVVCLEPNAMSGANNGEVCLCEDGNLVDQYGEGPYLLSAVCLSPQTKPSRLGPHR